MNNCIDCGAALESTSARCISCATREQVDHYSAIENCPNCDKFVSDLDWRDKEIDFLRADIEAAKAENAVLNRMVEAMAWRVRWKLCPADNMVGRPNCKQKSGQGGEFKICAECWLDYFRTEAEKGDGE